MFSLMFLSAGPLGVNVENILFIAVIMLICGMLTLFAATLPFRKRYGSWGRQLAAGVAGFLILIGTVGFFGSALSALGGLNWLPRSFEWPTGYVSGVVSLPSGGHLVPHTPSGRVQVYDQDWRFLHGWHVDAGGGTFKLQLASNDRIEVITARGNWRYTYTLAGDLISRVNYLPATYSSFPDCGESQVTPTRSWLWVFTSPFISVAVSLMGGAVLSIAERRRKPKDHSLTSGSS
jgi:YD repeat-containing protein